MPAQSQQQQKLFGLALSVKRGETPRSEASSEVLDIVDSMTEKQIEDFASTSHSGLPKKVEAKLRELVRDSIKAQGISEAVSSKDLEAIKGAVEKASSFMSVGSELKKLGMRYIFATSPMPVYIVQDKSGNRVGIVNKKYATKPDFVVGDIAVGVMENTLKEGLFQDIMKGVKKGDGPFTLVVIENNKVVKQVDAKTPQVIPAHYTSLEKEFPNSRIRVEDSTGKIVFGESVNEAVINELSADTYKNTVKAALQRGDSKGNSIAVKALQSFGKAVAKELAGKSFEVKGSKDNLAKGFYRGNSQKFINQFKMTFTGEGELINSRDVKVFGSDEVHFRMKVEFQVPDNIGGFSTDVKFRGYEKYKFPGSIQFSIKQGRVWAWFNSADTDLEFTRAGAREMAKLADVIVDAMDFPTKAKHNTIKQFDAMKPTNESINEADVVGKTVFSDGKGKLFFGYYKTDDAVEFVDYKTWKKLNFKDVSKGDTNKDRVIASILRNQKQFNKKVDYNMWAKKTNPSFEEKMDWFIKNGWISNITKTGIKESVESLDEKLPNDFATIPNDSRVSGMMKHLQHHVDVIGKNVKTGKGIYKKDLMKMANIIKALQMYESKSVNEENEPTNPELWDKAIAAAKRKYDVYPSAYANAFASKWYKEKGGDWKTKKESVNESSVEIGDIVLFPPANSAATVIDRFGRSVTLKLANGKKVKTVVDKIKLLAQDGVNQYRAIAAAQYNNVNKKFGSKYDIGAGRMGNGTTFWNRAEEEFGEYKKIAHVSDNGMVKFYDKSLPSNVKKHIEDYAKTQKESVNEHKDCGCGCKGTTVGGCNTSITEGQLNEWRAEEVLQQLGGRRFIAMTGAKNFVKNDKDKSIVFRVPKAKNSINTIRITLTSSDLYNVEFISVRGTNIKTVKEVKGVYNDQLQSIFTQYTGLYTSL